LGRLRSQGPCLFLPQKKLKRLFILLLPALLCACKPSTGSPTQVKANLSKTLPGHWRSEYLRIRVNSYAGRDSSFQVEADQNRQSELLFEAEFSTEQRRFYFRYPQKSQLNERGFWNTFGDTLLLVQPGLSAQYKVLLEKNRAQLSSLLDWDHDGSEDDEFYAILTFWGKRKPK
jgi:hypothetical protein